MRDDRDNNFKLMITQDKLVDLLMHAATREDIAKMDARVDARFNKMEADFNGKLDKVDARLDKMDARFDKLMFGIVFAILMPIAIEAVKYFFIK